MHRLIPCLALFAAFAAHAQEAEPTAAQPTLPERHLAIVSPTGARHDFTVELATTPTQQETGLMFRTAVPAGHGMLFDWGTAREVPMWMKNTLVPLDMVFIGADHRISHIAEDAVPQSLGTISSGGPVRETLELAAGTAAKLDLRVGDRVEDGF